MNIINKKHIFPVIVPTEQYQDRFGNQNSYIEMNPSLYIKDDGSFIILVRTVNYLKYKNKSFTIYGNSSNSIYSIMRGQLEDGQMILDNCDVRRLDVKYNIPHQWSLWYGIEDVRFVDDVTVLACIPECNNSNPCIFKGTLTDNVLTSFEKCSPSQIEKNWMPYEPSKVIYSVSPFIIKSIVEDDREEIPLSEADKRELEGWHGSSNGIDFNGDKLFLIHKNNERVMNRWLLLNEETKSVRYSKEFVFFKDSYFEFTCSLAKYEDRIWASIGVNDNKAFIVEMSQDEIMKLFV